VRLVVLGSGTGVPSATRASSGYWLEAGDDVRLRLDCGPGTVHAMAGHGVDWPRVSHQWVSHFHVDHALEIPALLFALKYGRGQAPDKRGPLTFIGPRGLRRLVEALVVDAFQTSLLEQQFPVDVRELAPGDAIDIGAGVALSTAKTPHTEESLAVRVESAGRAIGYTGDTAASPELAAFFRDVDVLVAECSFPDDPQGTRHLTAAETAALATAARAKHLVAVHAYFDPEREHLAERLRESFPGQITIAADGTTLEIE
jgi:ribonuclease BN (tRNA processing enzyme)